MGSGVPLSDGEKEYIWNWAYKKSWGAIAVDLGNLYADHNGGHRCWQTVKSFVRRKKKPSLKVGYYPVPIRADVLAMARAKGFSQFDLSDLLEDTLSTL